MKGRIARYGPGSEKLSNLQLQLLEEEPGVTSEEVQAESQREALPKPDEKKRQRRAHPGRQTLPANLPRVEKIVACTADQCVCGKCGLETKVIGYDESEVLCVKPAEYFVEVIKREKRACGQCEEQGVAMAPLPKRIIPGGRPDNGTGRQFPTQEGARLWHNQVGLESFAAER